MAQTFSNSLLQSILDQLKSSINVVISGTVTSSSTATENDNVQSGISYQTDVTLTYGYDNSTGKWRRIRTDGSGNLQVTAIQSGTWNIATITSITNVVSVTGTVAATQSGTWNIATITSITNVVSVTGTVAATQSGTWNINSVTSITNTVTVTGTVNAVQSGTWNIGTVTTLSQFPNGAALADNTANPTLTEIETFPTEFNGTTWDRKRSVGALNNTTLNGTLNSYINSGVGVPMAVLLGYDPTSAANAYRAIQVTSTGLVKVATP